jgi:hypothetical protein
MRWHLPLLAAAFATGLGSLAGAAPEPTAQPAARPGDASEFFETRVRPVLVESCLRCHGAKKQSSGLRVDSRDALLEGGENGPAIVTGDPDKSLLIQAVRQVHEDIRMPPKGKLPGPAVDALAEWVRRGAPWPEGTVLSPAQRDRAAETHWAFQPVRPVSPPKVRDAAWGSSPIDAFILAKLEGQGMRPSPRADRRTLIRRATIDLTGLPPTAEEIEAFEADTAPDAFARVVDRLLASPRYGERWGRHWLDVARYADTKGYVFTEERRYPYSYTYRDYVIRAFNEDLPYDQFLVEQIAADRLPHENDTRALAALGFLTVGRRFLNNQQDIIDDRIDVVTRGLLGLTVACARCHDHKFDPVPTDDYYSLYGVFASSSEPADLPLIVPAARNSKSADFERAIAASQTKSEAYLASKHDEIQSELRAKAGAYLLAAFDLEFNPRHPKLDEHARAVGVPSRRLRSVIGRWRDFLAKTRKKPDSVFAPWHALAALPADQFAERAPVVIRERLGAAGSNEARREVTTAPGVVLEALAASPPKQMRDVAASYAGLLEKLGKTKPGDDSPAWRSTRAAFYASDGPLSVPAEATVRLLNQSEKGHYDGIKKQVTDVVMSHPGAPARAMVMVDNPQPAEPRVLIRGNPSRPGKQVPRQFLKALSGPSRKPFSSGSGRLELARAIASPDNPLTARVLVNRLWLLHFGTGLVATPSDFGLRSDPPSHPELLDFLAGEFVRSGWSIKTMHRLIMLSSTYQQASGSDPNALVRDPEDRLVWRFARRRLDFEAMRDSLLAVSGGLDPTIGGRPVKIGEPPFSTRRTVYGFIDRQNLDGVYRTFDFASPDATSPRRHVTTVPQQALFLLNSPFVIERARQLAAAESRISNPEARVRAYYRRIFGRSPDPRELELGVRFVQEQERNPGWKAGSGALKPSEAALNPWEEYAQVLLLTNEFMFVD